VNIKKSRPWRGTEGGGYGEAAAKPLPHAQVADRWHLMENANHAFLDAVRKSMRRIRAVVGAATIDPNQKAASDLLAWIERARQTLVDSFANGIARDQAAVHAGIAGADPSARLVAAATRTQCPLCSFTWNQSGPVPFVMFET
jgi:transposase